MTRGQSRSSEEEKRRRRCFIAEDRSGGLSARDGQNTRTTITTLVLNSLDYTRLLVAANTQKMVLSTCFRPLRAMANHEISQNQKRTTHAAFVHRQWSPALLAKPQLTNRIQYEHINTHLQACLRSQSSYRPSHAAIVSESRPPWFLDEGDEARAVRSIKSR
jgi:hypothetical protein